MIDLRIVPGPIDKVHAANCAHARRSLRAVRVEGRILRRVLLAALRTGADPYLRGCEHCKPEQLPPRN